MRLKGLNHEKDHAYVLNGMADILMTNCLAELCCSIETHLQQKMDDLQYRSSMGTLLRTPSQNMTDCLVQKGRAMQRRQRIRQQQLEEGNTVLKSERTFSSTR